MFAIFLSFAFCIQNQNIRRPQISTKYSSFYQKDIRIPDNADKCEMCTKVVNYIEEIMNNTLVESEVATLVSLLCDTLPFPLSTGCSFIVKHYIPLIMQLLDQDLEALDICHKIGFCTNAQVSAIKTARLPKIQKSSRYSKKDQRTCLMCKEVIAYAEAAIQDDKIEEQVIEVIDQVCQSFSQPLANLCEAIIKVSVPTIMTWIEQGIEAIDICSRLKLCEA